MTIINQGATLNEVIMTAMEEYNRAGNSCYSCGDMGCVCEDENND